MPALLNTKPPLRALMSMTSGAAYLNLSVRHFRRLIEVSEMPIVEIQGRQYSAYFIRSADLLALENRNKSTHPKRSFQWDRNKIGPKKEFVSHG